MDEKGELYKFHSEKYKGRENLMEEVIPLLNCRWNDVVQFSAINPQILIDKLKTIVPGYKPRRTHFFKVPITAICSKYPAVVFSPKEKRLMNDYKIKHHEVRLLSANDYSEQFIIPELNIEFWFDAYQNDRPLLLFPYVDHIMVKGEIDVSPFEILPFI
jgi:hypothetical protein